MYRRLRLLILVCVLVLPVGAHAQESDPPMESVEGFYEWYLTYQGNPLSERAYQESPYLSEALIAEVDEMAEEEGGFHFDPFLCAQDIPQRFEVTPLGEESLLVNFFFSSVPHTASLELVELEGEWLIERIDCALPSSARPVESFYEWYLAYEGNPLAEGAYQESPYLSEELIAEVDEIAEDGFRFDPFLCAQDVPHYATVALMHEDRALVSMYFSGNPVPHMIGVEVEQVEGEWLIEAISCSEQFTPRGVVESFYEWYLAYEGNPLSDRAYQENPLLSEAFIAQIDGMFDAEGGIRFDPFLCAQDVPAFVQVEAFTETPERFLVKAGELTEFEVELSRIEGQWRISEIACP